jgi:hypothetical protein
MNKPKNKPKPKGKVPSLIGGKNGRPKRVAVGKESKCYRCKAIFQKGQTCVAIPQTGYSFSTAKRVCDECFQSILEQTDKDLEEIRKL